MKGQLMVNVKKLNLSLTLNTGQNFRWQKIDTNRWYGIISNIFVVILEQCERIIRYEIINMDYVVHTMNNKMNTKTIFNDFHKKLEHYFRLDIDLDYLYDYWCNCDDQFNQITTNRRLNGIRLLRQDIVENIFTFICSSNNNIQRITKMVKNLSENFGTKIYDCSLKSSNQLSEDVYSFPNVSNLIDCEEKLRKLGFGYRSKFICQTAKKIMNDSPNNNPNEWIKQLQTMSYQDSRSLLMSLPGIGAKVADCICLMSLQHTESVPIDTHVYRLTKKLYSSQEKSFDQSTKSLTLKKYDEIGNFYRKKFQLHPGWAQTILFCSDLRQISSSKL